MIIVENTIIKFFEYELAYNNKIGGIIYENRLNGQSEFG